MSSTATYIIASITQNITFVTYRNNREKKNDISIDLIKAYKLKKGLSLSLVLLMQDVRLIITPPLTSMVLFN